MKKTSEPIVRTPQELHDAIGRIGYSFELLTDCAAWIVVHGDWPQEDLPPSWNTYIEAFLIHARKLSDFFDPKRKPHPDDVVIGDFLPDEPTYKIDIADVVRDQISKRVAHFSHVPAPEDEEVMRWPIPGMVAAIRNAMEAFRHDLADHDSPQLPRLRKALVSSEPAFRKAVDRH